MTLEALHQFLLLYFWLGVAVLLLFWGLLTRYYQRFSKRRMFYRLLLLPTVLGGLVSVRSAAHPFAPPAPWDHLAAVVVALSLMLIVVRATFYMLRRG
ncbi:MAG: hypothetical protein SNJ54_12000 [Anaerolineae bacterium]